MRCDPSLRAFPLPPTRDSACGERWSADRCWLSQDSNSRGENEHYSILNFVWGVPMKKIIGIAAIATLIGTSAWPADMAVKAPPVVAAAAPANDWTGIYGDVGLGWQNDRFDWTDTNFVPPIVPFSMSSGTASITGHAGYQQQFNWLVVGGEIGTFQSMKGNTTSLVSNGVATGPCNNLAGYTCQVAIDYPILAGGKLGVDWGNWLVYGVGGAALNANVTSKAYLPSGVLSDIGVPQSAHGWYAGGGLDYLFYKTNLFDLIGGVEYEHVSLGTLTQCTVPQPGSAIVTGCPGTIAADSRIISAREDAVWAKLTVKFNPFFH